MEGQKVWWVLGYDTYYPSADNFRKSFATEEEAQQYIIDISESESWSRYDIYKVINISDRL